MKRGDVAICIVGAAIDDDLRAHTPPEVPVLEAGSRAEAFAQAAPADVVLVSPGCAVASGWLGALRSAAYASSTTATATALTQHDLGGAPASLERAAAAVQAASLRIRPRIERPGGACVYVRRSAIELVADDGTDFWSQCVARGLQHVLADDVLVLAPGPGEPPATQPPPTQSPATQPPATEPNPPESRAKAAARRAINGLSATIDARILAGPTTGTQVHVLELISGLARTDQVRLTAVIPDHPSEDALTRLRCLPHVKLVTYAEALHGERTDVVHRPFQLSNSGDLSFLKSLGERLILTQQDLIAFHNPAYFPSHRAWQEYRELTRTALASADRALFFSAHARDDALSEDLVDEAHADVVHLGVDHPQAVSVTEAPPADAEAVASRPFLLCLGTDFLHKNRLFALRLLKALGEQGVDAGLVFAGPMVAQGSSRPREASYLTAHPEITGHVADLGAVSEPEKQWLYNRCALVVYPTVLEGFGLIPFEAAANGVPCLWAPGSSLSELLPDTAAGIVPWDDRQTAENARTLMDDQQARERNLAAIDQAAQSLTWDATAERLLDAYRATADAPPRPDTAGGVTLTEDAARLVGPGGELPPDVHRPLLALATHPKIARPVWAVLRLGYRASHRLLQRRR